MDKDKVEVLKLLASIADKESDRIWTRYQIMFYASTGLLAILAWVLQNAEQLGPLGLQSFPVFVSALGFLVAVAWLASIILGRFYEKRWFADMDTIIDSDESLKHWVRARNSAQPRVIRLRFVPNIVLLYSLIPGLFLIFWAYTLGRSFVNVLCAGL